MGYRHIRSAEETDADEGETRHKKGKHNQHGVQYVIYMRTSTHPECVSRRAERRRPLGRSQKNTRWVKKKIVQKDK